MATDATHDAASARSSGAAGQIAALAAPAAPAGAREGAAVSLRSLSRSFGQVRALDGMSLEIAPGELVALLGPSGCGKTTALRIVAGFESADAGQVLISGKDVSGIPAARRDMGMVFQSYSLFPNMSALDNVAFGLRMRKVAGARRKQRAAELLDMVGLAAQARQHPHQLSGGQQQRVALARALAIEPRVLLLDEPLSALDAQVRVQLREQIRALQRRLGTTTLFVTHDQEEALSISDRVGVMRSGRLEQVAEPPVLYSRPATAFVAEFVGTMNRVPGELAAGGAQVTALGATVPAHDAHDAADGPVDVLVRPEGLSVTAAGDGNGIVTARTFRGAVTRVSVLISGETEVRIDVPTAGTAAMTPGAAVQVTLPPAPVLVAPRRTAGDAPVLAD
jgi:putative spermidine/putrescine transport system ATP-binding protein